MTETLFAFDERNYLDCQEAYRGRKKQEYYLGDYTIRPGSSIDVRADKKAVGSNSIIRLRSKTGLSFLRTWSHIQEDATDVMVLWFVKRGHLCIHHHGRRSVASAGEFAITKSMEPFSIECETDEDSLHEVLHVIVPAHEFRRFIPREIKSGFTVDRPWRELDLAEPIISEVFQGAGKLSEQTELLLLSGAMAAIAEMISGREECFLVRQSLREQRLEEVLRYIDIHLSDPLLSAGMVAEACGISPRYLSALLKENGTPFSELVWDNRVKSASQWLSTSRPSDISIAEIAFRVGFKSPAHFSRMFKRVFRQGPREFRTARLERRGASPEKQTEPLTGGMAGCGTNTLQ